MCWFNCNCKEDEIGALQDSLIGLVEDRYGEAILKDLYKHATKALAGMPATSMMMSEAGIDRSYRGFILAHLEGKSLGEAVKSFKEYSGK